tara:strand:+ start:1515 stop:1841 length:327 start_codon:yes stop_codon:yes gene_type:complete
MAIAQSPLIEHLSGSTGTATFTVTPKSTLCLTVVGTIGGGTVTPTLKDTASSPGTGMPLESVPGEAVAFTTEGHVFFFVPDVDQLIVTLAGASGASLTIKLGTGLTTP